MASSYNDEFIISRLCKHVNSTGICRCCRAGKNLSSKLAILVLGFVFVILTYLLSHRTAGHSSARQVKFIPFQEALLWKHTEIIWNHMVPCRKFDFTMFLAVMCRFHICFMRHLCFCLDPQCFVHVLSLHFLSLIVFMPRTRALGSATARLARLPRDDVFQKCFRFEFFEFLSV